MPSSNVFNLGTSALHLLFALTHLSWKTQPDGRFTGVGTSPLSLICRMCSVLGLRRVFWSCFELDGVSVLVLLKFCD